MTLGGEDERVLKNDVTLHIEAEVVRLVQLQRLADWHLERAIVFAVNLHNECLCGGVMTD
eukprot:CAMPEP_0185599412 /NCGR_PEP_ID=MMETSP0434-20130131/82692_1 /TAXON_ID=626734 ORGANISM="Favella taraikaensis, Strain Fe Narragansett Bay" /NCGR_SAMPLE_ID=MMETSP0434 /ASSEMBLY_ACC=CAM_ASM_000379 /LENGTH=59 /DNA_ID=CAMNT_0028228811 /DNA_START=531 /DNA_END=710 /DNA_ORIENTATION=+